MDKTKKEQLIKAMEKAICEKSFYEFFVKAFPIAEPSVPLSTNFNHKYLCDILQGEAERILKKFNVNAQKTRFCTYDSEFLYSFRKERTQNRLVTIIWRTI